MYMVVIHFLARPEPDSLRSPRRRLKRALEEKAPLFRGSRQHDAHEFLVALLDSMEQEILAAQAQRAGRADVPISEALCPTARNCVFVVTRKVTCHACGHESDGK